MSIWNYLYNKDEGDVRILAPCLTSRKGSCGVIFILEEKDES